MHINGLHCWRLLCAGMALLALCWAPATSMAKDPTVSLRYVLGSVEAELHLGSVGLLYGFGITNQTGFGSATLVGCSGTPELSYFGGRYFFGGPQDSFYLGAASFSLGAPAGCGSSPLQGVIPMIGYHWLWDSGFNLELGIRPGGVVAVGYSF